MNILVVRTDKLGDFITTLPAIYLLKNYNSDFKLHVLVAPLNKELASACSFIDEVIVDDTSSAFELSKKLKPYKIDLSFTMFSNTKVALAQFLCGIKTRVAPATKIAQIFYNRRIKQRRSHVKMSEYEYNIDLVKSYFNDLESIFPTPLLHVEPKNSTKKSVIFHPGFGGSSDANWSNKEYFQLIRHIDSTCRVQIIITFGPDESALYESFKEEFEDSDITLYQSRDGLLSFASYICGALAFVSTSTGTYHLAALVGVNTFTFFADTLFASVKRWKAVSDFSLQHPYMIPHDGTKRAELFEKVKTDLQGYINDNI